MRVKRGEAALGFMEERLDGREWFVGNRLSIADLALLPYTRLADQGGFDLEGRPRVRSWIRRCEEALGLPPLAH
jgi:glutathione S-transferase